MKFFDIFLIFTQNIDCGYTLEPPQRGGSNEYPQSTFWSKNKKKYVYPSKPHFFYIKVGCKGVFITRTCYPDVFKEVKSVAFDRLPTRPSGRKTEERREAGVGFAIKSDLVGKLTGLPNGINDRLMT